MTDQMDKPPPSRIRAWAERRARLAAPMRRAGPFASGIAAALVAVLLYSALVPGKPPLTQHEVDQQVAQALASETPGPALSQLVYEAVQPSLVLVQVQLAGPSPGAAAGPVAGPTVDASPGTVAPSAAATAGPSAAPGGGPAAGASPGPTGGPSPGPGAAPSDAPTAGPSAVPSPEPVAGLGSGVVVDQAGDILTSLHVVANATAIQVTFADGSQSPAQIVARQPENDIAVLQATNPPATLVPATLGNPRAAVIGSEAFVVGNPFGLYGSMSSGIISGLDRSFQLQGSNQVLHGLIQVDAAVNPGNSGGPLLNRDGQVIGIVAALLNPTSEDVFVGIGLAVPIDVAGRAAGLPQY